MNGVQLKQFINRVLGIPKGKLRAEVGKNWSRVCIMPDNRLNHREPMRYSYSFPPEFGNRCLRIVYAGSPDLCEQSYAGNIEGHSIAMHHDQWAKLAEQLEPVAAAS